MEEINVDIIIKFFKRKNIESLRREEIFFPDLNLFINNNDSLTDDQSDSQEAQHTTILDKENEGISIIMAQTDDCFNLDFESGEINLKLPKEDIDKMFISSFTLLNSIRDFDVVNDFLVIKDSVVDGLLGIANGRPFVMTNLETLKQSVKKHFQGTKYSVYNGSY